MLLVEHSVVVGWCFGLTGDRRQQIKTEGPVLSPGVAEKLPSIDLQGLALRSTSSCLAALEPQSHLSRIVSELVIAGGKRVRPLVTYLVGACEGLDPEALDNPAVISELVHTASLLHDDFIDEAVTRRNRPTAWVTVGPRDAVLAGDLALTVAMRLTESGPAAARLRLLDVIEAMTEAQSAERLTQASALADVDGWLSIAEGKTAALLGWCAEAAALHAGNRAVCTEVRAMGEGFGLAFQAVDDLLDLVPGGGAGKPACTDLRAKVASLPIRLAARNSPALCARIEAVWNGEKDDLTHLSAQIFQQSEVELVAFVDEQFGRVRFGLEALRPHPARDALAQQLEYVRHRMRVLRETGQAWSAQL